ncbi:CSC1-like protein At3g54510 isoform X1 [Malus sylvestris]|uniref:CSC1-like protein At3g54510 isoform X1 n=1 Tax=Malus sylvestris TaxID=3752 RepID=UPI0021ABA096|nr:CSC1-like protein At3g54510 isoform X1 [Malus sylvestris]
MNPESLIASAAINIGLAIFILTLFSVLKKQPSNAPIYYPRRLSESNCQSHRRIPDFDDNYASSPVGFRRFLPSVTWIFRAFRVSEDEILQSNGLDALIIIRLFKFGIRFFVVCSLIGLVVLVPVNYNGDGLAARSDHSLDFFSISNISPGSNRLWVHCSCLWFISLYGVYLLHKEYKEILAKRIQQLLNVRHQPNQFNVLVREIPFCSEHKSRGCCVDEFFSKHHPYAYHSYQILYDGKEFKELLNQSKSIEKKIEDLRKRSVVKKHNQTPLLLNPSHEDSEKLSVYEEKLEELHHKIHQLQCEDMLHEKELPVAFVTFKSRLGAALVVHSQQHSNPLLWITDDAPEPRDVSWRNLAIPVRVLPLCNFGVIVAASLLTIFFAIPVTAVQGIAKFEKLKKWFPPAMALQLIPGLSSVITGYIPSAVLNLFIYIVPFAMLGMAKLSGCISKSREEIKACNMVFYFLVGNVFFWSLLSGSLIDEIGESFTHPKDIPSHLARAVSAQADFFVTYILTDGLSGFSLEILQPGLLCWDAIRSCTYGRGKETTPYLYSLPYFRIIPVVSLSVLIGTVYAVVAPLMLPFLIGYFLLGYAVYINQIEDVYETFYDTCGQYWPYINHYILVAIILMQITMIGLFGLKSKPAASFSTIPLLVLTLMFNEYCKMRFLPAFHLLSIQNAKEFDELDEKCNQVEFNYENASTAYCPPCLRPLNCMESGSSHTPPLVTSSSL